jgi:hypothetical protein
MHSCRVSIVSVAPRRRGVALTSLADLGIAMVEEVDQLVAACQQIDLEYSKAERTSSNSVGIVGVATRHFSA